MKGQNVVLKADRNLFSEMILVAESISVNMKDVLATQWAHCHEHWLMQMGPYEKQTKPHLPQNLRKHVSPAEAIRTPSTCIIDWMGLVQRMNGNNNIFAQLAEPVLSMVQSGWVDVIFDAYRQPSIKYSETLNRGATLSEYLMVQAQPFSTNAFRGTQHTAVETIPVQFLQQDEPHQVIGWRVETTAIQIYAAWLCIVCHLRRNLLQHDSR